MIEPLSTLVLILVLICAVAVMMAKKLISAVIIFGAFSFFSALFFVFLQALDVAFTEATVGAALTTIFFVTAIHESSRGKETG